MQEIKIIKVGGNVIDQAEQLDQFIQDFSTIKGGKILVHGGGKAASKMGLKLGIEPKMIDGRRITDKATLEVVTMVYGGLVNKTITAKLQAVGCNAIGLTGADANIIPATKRNHPTIDFGYVGDIETRQIDSDKVKLLLDAGLTPVFCALTHDKGGCLLNTNADTIASSLAIAVSKHFKVNLTYCFEKAGVLTDADDNSTLISALDKGYYSKLKTKKIIFDGMIPKLDNAYSALESGVEMVEIKHANNLLSDTGTKLLV